MTDEKGKRQPEKTGEGPLPVQVSGEGQARVHQGTLSSPLPHWQTERRRSDSGREQGRG